MAGLFEKLSQSVSETSKNVKGSVADSREKASLKKSISVANDKIAKLKAEMGEKVYEAYTNDESADSECVAICEQIADLYAEIDRHNIAILALEGFRKCDSCGEKIALDANFCSFCGAKQEKLDIDIEQDIKEAVAESAKTAEEDKQ